jgi:hypothetical protein
MGIKPLRSEFQYIPLQVQDPHLPKAWKPPPEDSPSTHPRIRLEYGHPEIPALGNKKACFGAFFNNGSKSSHDRNLLPAV